MIIAIIVFTPESITAVKAALANQMQRAINLCLGAFVSTVGLTVPVVLLIGLLTQQNVTMGLGLIHTVLLAITVLLSTLTFFGLRTAPVQGMMHLAPFCDLCAAALRALRTLQPLAGRRTAPPSPSNLSLTFHRVGLVGNLAWGGFLL